MLWWNTGSSDQSMKQHIAPASRRDARQLRAWWWRYGTSLRTLPSCAPWRSCACMWGSLCNNRLAFSFLDVLFACLSPCLFSVLCIISVVTPLTQGSQIIVRAVFGGVVEVCYRQDDICVLARLRIIAVCVVLHSAELAAVLCSLQYPFPYLFPVIRVSWLVLRLYRHFRFCCKDTPHSRASGVVLWPPLSLSFGSSSGEW